MHGAQAKKGGEQFVFDEVEAEGARRRARISFLSEKTPISTPSPHRRQEWKERGKKQASRRSLGNEPKRFTHRAMMTARKKGKRKGGVAERERKKKVFTPIQGGKAGFA